MTTPLAIQRVAVVGAGLMAPGLVQVLALGGAAVHLVARSAVSLERSTARLRANLDAFVAEGLTSADEAAAAFDRVTASHDLAAGVGDADLVVETITEDLDLKRHLFAELDGLAPANAILATNTSGLAIADIARDCRGPERAVTAHFWNPAHLLPIVEVVGHPTMPEATIAGFVDYLRSIGQEPIRLRRDARGFVGNRLQYALFREAMAIVADGIASAADVDAVVKRSFGRRLTTVGPLETCDLAGLDLVKRVVDYLIPDLDASRETPAILRELVAAGHLGAKVGRGLHEWPGTAMADTLRRRDAELLRWRKRDLLDR